MAPKSDESETKSERINLAVYPSEKSDWETAAEEEFGGNMSLLVRRAVSEKVNGGVQPMAESSGTGGETEELATIADTLDKIQDSIQSLEGRMSSLESETQKDPDIDRLASEIFDLLPGEEPGSDAWEREKTELQEEYQHTESEAVHTRLQAWEGTPEGLSKATGEARYKVKEAVDKLISDTQLVRETTNGRYWRND